MAKQTVTKTTTVKKTTVTLKPKSRSEISKASASGTKNQKLSSKAKNQKRSSNGQFA